MILESPNPRGELVAEIRRLLPYVRFLKTDACDSDTYYKQKDTPQFLPGQTFQNPADGKIYQQLDIYLPINSYPRILSSMTAMEAGAYALKRCLKEKWEITDFNLQAVLTNLEMEM